MTDVCALCADIWKAGPACDRCKFVACYVCYYNELNGLCPVCDREQLNAGEDCVDCHQNKRVGLGLTCPTCDEFVCYECFGGWKHGCPDNDEDDEDADA